MQQPPNQYPHYPPQWQQPPVIQPPQPKKHGLLKFFAIGCGALALLFVLIIVLAVAIGTGEKSTTSTSTNTGQSSQSSNSGQPTPKVGVPFVVNDTWTVTVNSIKTSQGGVLDAPKPGNTLLVVNVTLKNTSSAVQRASGLLQWSLKDATTGQTYDADLAYGTDPGGPVAPGSLTRGDLAYEVPKSVHSFTLQFVSSIGNSDLTEWNISI